MPYDATTPFQGIEAVRIAVDGDVEIGGGQAISADHRPDPAARPTGWVDQTTSPVHADLHPPLELTGVVDFSRLDAVSCSSCGGSAADPATTPALEAGSLRAGEIILVGDGFLGDVRVAGHVDAELLEVLVETDANTAQAGTVTVAGDLQTDALETDVLDVRGRATLGGPLRIGFGVGTSPAPTDSNVLFSELDGGSIAIAGDLILVKSDREDGRIDATTLTARSLDLQPNRARCLGCVAP